MTPQYRNIFKTKNSNSFLPAHGTRPRPGTCSSASSSLREPGRGSSLWRERLGCTLLSTFLSNKHQRYVYRVVHSIPSTYWFYTWRFVPFEFPVLLTLILLLFFPFLFVSGVHRSWVPRPGIELRLSAVKVQSPNHWPTSEFLPFTIYSDEPLGFL